MTRSRGLGLVELLVAVSLVALLAAVVMGAFIVGHRSVQGMAEGLDANQQLRAALKMMSDDLSYGSKIAGNTPFCLDPDGYTILTYTCEITVAAFQPRSTRTAYDSFDWTKYPDWPGDLDGIPSRLVIRYRLVEAPTDPSDTISYSQLIREVGDGQFDDRVYSSRVLLSGLISRTGEGLVDEASRFVPAFDPSGWTGLVTTELHLPAQAGGSADEAQISSAFFIR